MLITFEQLFLFLSVYIPLLLTVAFFVLFERKFLASVQRRVGPKIIGLWGLLQSIADGLKLLLKQYISPSKINQTIFFYSPILCFTLSFSSWTAIPFTFINVLCEINSQVLLVLSLSSLNVYTIIFSGWSSNSKYALFGSLRAAAQVISYELALTTSLLPVVLSSGSLNFSSIVNQQQNIYYFFLFFPVSFIFFITAIAETNRPPFDLPEAEAEIVAGYNVEYSSMPFAFFFLAEYCNVLTMCGSWSIFFGGGWLNFIGLSLIPIIFWFPFKTCFLSSLFVFIRGILPRYRYDQLMSLGWKVLFPFAFSFFVFSAGSFCFFGILPDNSNNLFIDQYDLNKILYPTYSKTVSVLGGSLFLIYKKKLIDVLSYNKKTSYDSIVLHLLLLSVKLIFGSYVEKIILDFLNVCGQNISLLRNIQYRAFIQMFYVLLLIVFFIVILGGFYKITLFITVISLFFLLFFFLQNIDFLYFAVTFFRKAIKSNKQKKNFVCCSSVELLLLYYIISVILLIIFIFALFIIIFPSSEEIDSIKTMDQLKSSEPETIPFPNKWYRFGPWFALLFFFAWAVASHIIFVLPLLNKTLLGYKAASYLVFFYLLWPLVLIIRIILPGLYIASLLPPMSLKKIKEYWFWFFFSSVMFIFLILIFCAVLLHMCMFLNKTYKYLGEFSSKYDAVATKLIERQEEIRKYLQNQSTNQYYFKDGRAVNRDESWITEFSNRILAMEPRPDTYNVPDNFFSQFFNDLWSSVFYFAEQSTLNMLLVVFAFVFLCIYLFLLLGNNWYASNAVKGEQSHSMVYEHRIVKFYAFEFSCWFFGIMFIFLCLFASKQVTWDILLFTIVFVVFLFLLNHFLWKFFTYRTGKQPYEFKHTASGYMQLRYSKKLGYNPQTHWVENGKVYTYYSREEVLRRGLARVCPETQKLLPLQQNVNVLKKETKDLVVVDPKKFPMVSRYYRNGIAYGYLHIHENQTISKNEQFKVEVFDLNEQALLLQKKRKEDDEYRQKLVSKVFILILVSSIFFWGSYYVITIFF